MSNNFKKYFALSLILVLGFSIAYMLKAYITPIFGAIILSFLLFPVYEYLTRKTKGKILSAIIIFIGILFILTIPLSILSSVMLNHVNDIDFSGDSVTKYEDSIYKLTGQKIMISEELDHYETILKDSIKTTLPKFLSYTTNFVLSLFIMFFIMFYLFTEKEIFRENFISIIPFSKKNSIHLLDESGKIVKAVFIGQVLTAAIQGLLGMFAFMFVGVPDAIFWGIIMILLSIIPMIGAFLIWVPAGIILIANGALWQGVFILLWGTIVVSQIDNLVRPKLVNKFADIHPLETFLGIFMGIAAFGFIGIIIGPLIVSLFSMVIKIYRQEYGDKTSIYSKK